MLRRTWATGVVFGLAVLCGQATAQVPPPKDLLTKGQALIREKKFDEAIDLCMQELKSGSATAPFVESLLQQMVYAPEVRAKPDDFIRALEKRVAEISHPSVFRTLGELHQPRNTPKAIEYFQKALVVAPNDSRTLDRLGSLLYYSARRYKEAAEVFERLVAMQPANTYAYRRLAECYVQLGRKADAEALAQKALDRAPDSASSFTVAAAIYKALGEKDKVVSFYRQALTKPMPEPTKGETQYLLAEALENAGQMDEAEPLYEQVTQTIHGWFAQEAQRRLARLRRRSGRVEAEIEKLKTELATVDKELAGEYRQLATRLADTANVRDIRAKLATVDPNEDPPLPPDPTDVEPEAPPAAPPPDGLTPDACAGQVRSGAGPAPTDALAWTSSWIERKTQPDGIAQLAEAFFQRAASPTLTLRAAQPSISREGWESVGRAIARQFALAFPQHPRAWPLAQKAVANYEAAGAPSRAIELLAGFGQKAPPALAAQAKLRAAEIRAAHGQWHQSVAECEALLASLRQPQAPSAQLGEAIFRLASLHFDDGRLSTARDYCLNGLGLFPKDKRWTNLAFRIGIAFFYEAKRTDAEDVFRHIALANEDTPTEATALGFLTAVYAREHDEGALHEVLKRRAEHKHLSGTARQILFELLCREHLWDDAFALAKRPFKDEPWRESAMNRALATLAEDTQRFGREDVARQAYDLFCTNYPKDNRTPTFLLRQAQLAVKTDDTPAARAACQKLLADFPEHPTAKQAKDMLGKLGE